MLAQRMPSILPPLTSAEAVEVTRIHSLLGQRVDALAQAPAVPRAPPLDHGRRPGRRRAAAARVGEVVLAHNGVLFLDELSEFARPTLEALRQPLEDGRVAIVAAATRPCTRRASCSSPPPTRAHAASRARATGAAAAKPNWPAIAGG